MADAAVSNATFGLTEFKKQEHLKDIKLEDNDKMLTAYYAGNLAGDIYSFAIGGLETATGATVTGTGGAVTVLSGGLLGVIGAPIALTGEAVVAVGCTTMAISSAQLYSDFGSFRDSIKFSEGTADAEKILGKNGTQFESKTTWQNGKTERVDVENPSPGERPGQIHYHEPNNTKWYLDIEKKQFFNQKTGELAPNKIQKLLKDKDVINAINKGLKFLGEDKLK